MKRAILILMLGVIGATLSYCVLYFRGTSEHRALLHSAAPELAWLKHEFRLSDTEFQRIADLHQGYKPRCEEMCRRIAGKQSEMRQLLAGGEINATAWEQKLAEASALRLQCQTNMLQHFISVSLQMPPEQGRRYLAWMQERTFLEKSGMMESHH
jgi:Spy/CpxP family protein refolding chaperone